MAELDCFLAVRPSLGHEPVECGDIGIVKEFDNKLFFGMVDVLGHGREAHELAVVIRDFLEKNCQGDLVVTMQGLHECLKLSRGAVAGLGVLDLGSGELRYVGVGNITARKFGSSSLRLVPRQGIVGFAMRTLREETVRLDDGDVLVVHTDGVQECFDLSNYPQMVKDNPETICRQIIERFGKEEDDAACIALRYRR